MNTKHSVWAQPRSTLLAPRGGAGRAPPPRRPAVRSSPSLVWRARSAPPVPGDKGRFRGRRPQVRKGGFSVAGHNVDFSIQAKRSPLRSRLKGNVSDVAPRSAFKCMSKVDFAHAVQRETVPVQPSEILFKRQRSKGQTPSLCRVSPVFSSSPGLPSKAMNRILSLLSPRRSRASFDAAT